MEKEKLKKIVLFTGYACSNRCRFCIDADKRGLSERGTGELLREIYSAKAAGADILEIIGGESTMRRDFRVLVRTAKKIGIEEVICATNGRIFADREYVRQVIEAGLDSIIFSLHGAVAEVHDFLTDSPGSFNELLHGVENFQSAGFRRIYGNTTVVRQNYRQLPEIAEMYARWRFTNVEFIFVDPTYGGAYNNFEELVPHISEAAPFMRMALDTGTAAGLTQWKVRYVPLCHFTDHLDHISEINERRLYISEHWAQDFYNDDSIGSRAEVSRRKTAKCDGCSLAGVCEGIWKVYLDHYGEEELRPVPAADLPVVLPGAMENPEKKRSDNDLMESGSILNKNTETMGHNDEK